MEVGMKMSHFKNENSFMYKRGIYLMIQFMNLFLEESGI